MRILLLKRSETDNWMPNKWALVGGHIEEGEEPQEALSREIEEECGLDIDNFLERFTIQRNENLIEQIFACRLPQSGDYYDIMLSDEHSDSGWFKFKEIHELDCVPNLVEYIKMAIEKYE